MRYSGNQGAEREGAIAPAVWYLLNLLALPIIGFVVVLWIALTTDESQPLRKAHSRAGAIMSVTGAVLISSGVTLCWLIFGFTGMFWTYAIVWAIVLHTSFVLWGMIALAQAIGGKPPYFPRCLM